MKTISKETENLLTDEVISGLQNGNLIIISAGPSMEKTSFLLSIVKNLAVDKKIPIGMFSLELSNVQLVNRLLQTVCEISGENIKSGKLTELEWSKLSAHIEELQEAPIYVDDTLGLSVEKICTKARVIVKEYGAKVVLIDYLQLLSAEGLKINSEASSFSHILRSLEELANELDIPIIVNSLQDPDIYSYADVVSSN